MKPKRDRKIYQEWFDIGDEELKFAKASFKDLGAFYPQICFQCQQAAEKYLKGYLVLKAGKFPKVHDLTHLLKLCAKFDKNLLKFSGDTDILSQYYLIARYPILEYPPAEKKEAKEALTIAEKIINFIKKETGK